MPRSGTLVICVQNLDFSGANQVVLNIVAGKLHQSSVVVLSPKMGSFAARFIDSGAAIRIGELANLLKDIKDVFCILCNTIMTANTVVTMAFQSFPIIWILHEWWDDDMISDNLKLRNMTGLTPQTVKDALGKATNVVFVCEAQRKLYKPVAPSSIIYVGVPDPQLRFELPISKASSDSPIFTVLCLGIVCPRKNQKWTVELFKSFAQGKQDVRLVIVGARRTRLYEIEYLEELQQQIGSDPLIELHDVTDNVDTFYAQSDCLMLTSLNEVTPMVISEAMSWRLPVLSTNIAGIGEMFTDGVEGFLFSPGDADKALSGLNALYGNCELRGRMAAAARQRFESRFDLDLMVESYQQLVMQVAPITVLLDMDGTLVDWDAGFLEVWDASIAPVNRTTSYFMEQCVSIEHNRMAELVPLQRGFFENLPPMRGALQAVREMEAMGFNLVICTAPVLESQYCVQEKLNWIRKYLGERWLKKTVLVEDKTMVRGDVLIDDKPYEYLYPGGKHSTATWKQILFDQPYNRQLESQPKILDWAHWREPLYALFGLEAKASTTAFPAATNAAGGNSNGLHVQTKSNAKGAGDSHVVKCHDFDVFDMTSPTTARIPRHSSGNTPTPTAPSTHHRKTVTHATVATEHKLPLSPEEVQKQVDQLQLPGSSEPLSPEDIASIVSGSVSLLDEEDFYDLDELLEENEPGVEGPMHEKAEKKRAIKEKLSELSKSHMREVVDNERKMALESDDAEIDGLQVFRESYTTWKAHVAKKN